MLCKSDKPCIINIIDKLLHPIYIHHSNRQASDLHFEHGCLAKPVARLPTTATATTATATTATATATATATDCHCYRLTKCSYCDCHC